METLGTGLFNEGKWGEGDGRIFLTVKREMLILSLIFVDEIPGTGLFNEGKWEEGDGKDFLIIKRETF